MKWGLLKKKASSWDRGFGQHVIMVPNALSHQRIMICCKNVIFKRCCVKIHKQVCD
jgi:hypothetical protein